LRALVLGAGGQLGTELVRLLGAETAVPHGDVSITDAGAVESLIAERGPDVVFNCAAYNAVDRAESEPDIAFAVNAQGPRNIAISTRRHGVALVHFSTNFVFDGRLDQPYVEADAPSPLSTYGSSKLAGERMALEDGGQVLVVRTAAVFGGARSFPRRILESAHGGQPLRVVSDQRVNPTYAKDLGGAAVELALAGVAGIVHVVAEGCCGWDELARAVLAESGVDRPVESVPASAYPAPARRPGNGCLASTRFRALRPWREALREALRA
jgi:dTDP-4-dehydrorhamnose reductase